MGKDFNPLSLGSSAEFTGQLAFAGYGITAKELQYDDFGAFDAKGKVVIVLRKEPQQDNPASLFDGKDNSQYAFFTAKELNAAMHGVAALLLVNDSRTVEQAAAKLKEDLARAESALKDLKNSPEPTETADKERRENAFAYR